MKTNTFAPSFFVKKQKRVSANHTSSSFLYKNTEATLIIDGELDLSGADNNLVLHAKKIIVTPRGLIMGENVCLKAEEAVVVHGKVRAKGNLEVDSPVLLAKGGEAFVYSWLGLRQQICSYQDESMTVGERVDIAEHSIVGMTV